MTEAKLQFDYTNQAWLKDGLYIRCGHKECKPPYRENKVCFGTRHAGELPNLTAEVR